MAVSAPTSRARGAPRARGWAVADSGDERPVREGQELPPRAGAVEGVAAGRRPTGPLQLLPVEPAARRDRRVDPVGARAVEPEDLGLQLLRQRRVAVALLQLGADLEGAEGLDLVL